MQKKKKGNFNLKNLLFFLYLFYIPLKSVKFNLFLLLILLYKYKYIKKKTKFVTKNLTKYN